ncbi:WecB/TagA/CpsF family glycosyltransferase [Blastococcus sp. SYSU DS0617]
MPTAAVGPFQVADARSSDIVSAVADRSEDRCVAFALHVGGLNHGNDFVFRSAISVADVLYADGAAVVLLARLAGARRIERSPTTDLGLELLRAEERRRGRALRIAVVGGQPGVAESALDTLGRGVGIADSYSAHGYHDDYSIVLRELRSWAPDVVIVGLGMPSEAKWVARHIDALPDALIFTCGGWLGFLAGHEKRAPKILQTTGLEWVYRLKQDPRRLAARYGKGLLVTIGHVPGQVIVRRRTKRA